MNYLLYGLETFIKNRETSKITKDIDANSISRYDLDINLIDDIILDAMTVPLFSSKKIIIIDNSNIFTAKKNNIEQKIDSLESYLSKPNPDTIIIFLVNNEKLDERKKITKFIKKHGVIIECNKPKTLYDEIYNLFDNYKVDTKLISVLIDRVGDNLGILSKEIEKIKCYKDDDKLITQDDILNITSKNYQPDLFLFIESLINKDIGKAFSIYEELLIFNEEPIKIIVMLANQFRLIYQSKLLIERGYDISYISSELNVHPYRVKLALEKGRLYSSKMVLEHINKLADLDYNIKTGKIDKNLGLELFILNI